MMDEGQFRVTLSELDLMDGDRHIGMLTDVEAVVTWEDWPDDSRELKLDSAFIDGVELHETTFPASHRLIRQAVELYIWRNRVQLVSDYTPHKRFDAPDVQIFGVGRSYQRI